MNKVWNALGIIGGGLAAVIVWSQMIPEGAKMPGSLGNFFLGLKVTSTFHGDFPAGAFVFPFIIGAGIVAFIMFLVAADSRQKRKVAAERAEAQADLMP